jgi:hypothetical protein
VSRWYRPVALGLSALFIAYGVFVLAILVTQPEFGAPGSDRAIYVGAAQRWLGGGSYFYPEQLAGRYELLNGHVLYPPPALLVFAVLSALPTVLWWAIPLAVIAAVIWHHRPAPWAWPLIAACVGFQWSVMLVWTGNPTLWVAAAVALGTVWGWPAVAVFLKPTLVPFALIGAKRRSWWLVAALCLAVSIPFGAMWIDWLHAVLNAYGWRVGPLYSLGDVPWLAAPAIAGIARRRPGSGLLAPPPTEQRSARPTRGMCGTSRYRPAYRSTRRA